MSETSRKYLILNVVKRGKYLCDKECPECFNTWKGSGHSKCPKCGYVPPRKNKSFVKTREMGIRVKPYLSHRASLDTWYGWDMDFPDEKDIDMNIKIGERWWDGCQYCIKTVYGIKRYDTEKELEEDNETRTI
jgi:hypothetical protein